MNQIPEHLRRKIFERDNFSCQKCNFSDKSTEDLEIHHINPRVLKGLNIENNLVVLCSICHKHAPDSEQDFKIYVCEKIDGKILNTFRKSNYSISRKTKQGMNNQFNQGKHLTKAPKGYKIVDKQLIINPVESEQTKSIFQEFLETKISLTKLAKKHNMTTTGIKKLLQNTTYLGKVKFANQESQGNHKPLINKEIFEKTQEKLKKKSKTNIPQDF